MFLAKLKSESEVQQADQRSDDHSDLVHRIEHVTRQVMELSAKVDESKSAKPADEKYDLLMHLLNLQKQDNNRKFPLSISKVLLTVLFFTLSSNAKVSLVRGSGQEGQRQVQKATG